MLHVFSNCDYANGYSIDVIDGNNRDRRVSKGGKFILRDGTILSIKSIPENNKNEN